MKKYKFLVPVVLVVLFGLSIYKLYSDRSATRQKYDTLLAGARECRSLGVVVDANQKYQAALEIRPSASLGLELGEMYMESNLKGTAEEWGKELVSKYPKDIRTYEYLMEVYRSTEDFEECFRVYEKARGNKLTSEKLEEIHREIEYTFTLGYACFGDAGIYSGTLSPVKVKELWGYVNQKGKLVVDAKFKEVGAYLFELAPVMEPDGSVYFIDASGNKKHVVRGVENVRKLGIVSGTTYSLYNGKMWDFYSLENDTRLFGGYEDASGLGNGVAAVKQGKKWGLINGSGEALTQPVFDGIVQDEKTVVCRNERLFAKKGTKYLMIDATGTQIGTQTFDDARLFADTTYAAVRQNGKWGFVDKDGAVVIPLQYEDARSFSNGLAAVKKGEKWGFVDLENNMVIAPQFEDVRDFNSSGNVFVELDSEWQCLSLYQYNH